MRLLVFADIHGNAYALDALVSMLSTLSFDRIAFLGDVFGYYYEQERCITLLKNIPNLIWLKGNHDSYAVKAYYNKGRLGNLIRQYGHSYDQIKAKFCDEEISFVDKLPSSYELHMGDTRVGLFHGKPDDALEGRIYPDTVLSEEELKDYDVIITGHTHCKIDKYIGDRHVVSPGSLGQPRDGKGYGFVIYDSNSDTCEFENVEINNSVLEQEIDMNDPSLSKLYDVLSREKV